MIRAFCDHRNQVIVPTEQGWEDGYGTEGNSSYAGRFDTAGCAAETGIPTVCKVGHTDTQSVDADGEKAIDFADGAGKYADKFRYHGRPVDENGCIAEDADESLYRGYVFNSREDMNRYINGDMGDEA